MVQVGIIQFSTGINLHLPLDSYSDEAFKETIDGMVSFRAARLPNTT